MNPFVYGRVVGQKEFCPRPDLEAKLRSHVLSNQNVLVEGERRVGKTSLICETVRKIKNSRLLYIDLMEIKDTDELCRRMFKAVFSMSRDDSVFLKALKSLAHLKPVFSVDPATGSPTVTLGASAALQPNSIESLLDIVYRERGSKKTVVVFDEFQDILKCADSSTVLGIMRGKIQFHTEIPYVFSGSVRNAMNAIFTSPGSPFFKSAVTLSVGPIEEPSFSAFISKKFASGRRKVSDEFLGNIFSIAQQNPGDIQQFCAALWDSSGEGDSLDDSITQKALQLIFGMEIKGYETELNRISAQQQRCLLGLARQVVTAPLSAGFLSVVGIPQPGSVKKAIGRLVELRIVYKAGKEYRFTNPFFKAWLVSRNL